MYIDNILISTFNNYTPSYIMINLKFHMVTIPKEERALILQGGGSLGAYEAGSCKVIYSFLKYRDKEQGNASRPTCDIVAGTSIGAINSAILVSHVIENKTWEGSAEKLIDFWNYISIESIPEQLENYFLSWWDYFRNFNKDMGTAEAARRYYVTKLLSSIGAPKVFSPPYHESDKKFFDPFNGRFRFDNKPLKKSLERFAKFPIATSQENNQPRLILTAVDVDDGTPVVFDSYAREDGRRRAEYGRYIVDKNFSYYYNDEKEIGFEHVIRYDEGITSDHVIASAAVPVNFDYVQLEVESYNPQKNNYEKNFRNFWDGGLLSNTPFYQLVTSQRHYWYKVRRIKDTLPRLQIVIINLHPARSYTSPSDRDGLENRKEDIMFADRSKYDENAILLLSDLADLVKKMYNIAKENNVKLELFDNLFATNPASHGRLHGLKSLTYRDMIEGQYNIGEVLRLERKNDENAIYNKSFDFSSSTIKRLIQDGYNDAVDHIKTHFGNEFVLGIGLGITKEERKD